MPGETSYYMPEGSAYQAFTPYQTGGNTAYNPDSPLPRSPTQIDYYAQMKASGTTPIYAGMTPGPMAMMGG